MTSSKWCQSIYDIRLYQFEDAVLNGNLAALTLSGYPTDEELQNAWQDIIQEYSDALGNAEYRMYINLYKEVEILKLDYGCVGIAIAALRKNYSAYMCRELNKILRTTCKFNINDVPTYMAELDKCERRSKSMKINLDLKMIEFEGIKNKITRAEGVPIDKNYFTSVLIVLSKHNTYKINKEIFLNEYVEYLKQYNEYADAMAAASAKAKR